MTLPSASPPRLASGQGLVPQTSTGECRVGCSKLNRYLELKELFFASHCLLPLLSHYFVRYFLFFAVEMAQENHLELAPAELWIHANPTTTSMWKFMEHVNSTYGLHISDYLGLHNWSIDNVANFWKEVWHFVGVKSSQPFREVGVLLRPPPPRVQALDSLIY